MRVEDDAHRVGAVHRTHGQLRIIGDDGLGPDEDGSHVCADPVQMGPIGGPGDEAGIAGAGRDEPVLTLCELSDDLFVRGQSCVDVRVDSGQLSPRFVCLRCRRNIVVHPQPFAGEIGAVLRPVGNMHPNTGNDLDAQILERMLFARIRGQQSNSRAAELTQNRCRRSVVTSVVGQTEGTIGADSVHALILERICLQLRGQPDSATFMFGHIDEYSVSLGGDGRQCSIELVPAVAPMRTQSITGEALAVHADQRSRTTGRVAHRQDHMSGCAGRERFDRERAMLRGQ